MAWLAVITAGVLEVGFATMLKLSNNFTKTWPSIGS
jgi:quaternary ammonium compound-resistance protein SugE